MADPGPSCSVSKAEFKEKLRKAKEKAYEVRIMTKKLKAEQRRQAQKSKLTERQKQASVEQTSQVEGLKTGPARHSSSYVQKRIVERPIKPFDQNRPTHEANDNPITISDNRRSSRQKLPQVKPIVKESNSSAKKKPPKKKAMCEKAIEERRIKERDKKRKQREKLRQNPAEHEKSKQKERERNKKRKASGKLKSINEKTSREQRLQRTKWKENMKRFREKQAMKIRAQAFMDINSPSSSISSPQYVSTDRIKAGRKKVRRDRSAAYRQLLVMKKQIKKLEAKAEKYKKRAQRAAKSNGTPTPRKKVKQVLKQGQRAVKKRLLFGEALVHQLAARSKQFTTQKEHQLFLKCVSGSTLKKYRLINQAKPFISNYANRKYIESASLRYYRKKKKNSLNLETIGKSIQEFLEEDCNSFMAPGKDDTITRHKERKQKRYLAFSLKTLHKKFNETSQVQVSYVSFCRLKPFWLVQPKLSGRDSCLCVKHANYKYITEKLHYLKITKQKNVEDICGQVCCNKKRKECMYGECKRCKAKSIPVVEGYERSTPTFYHQWLIKKETRTNFKNKPINVKFISKEKIRCTTGELVTKAQDDLLNFLKHVFNVSHQFESLKHVKNTLQDNEVLLHIDFSENYVCKYAEEVQSAHFGAAKTQVTLHTGVFYFKEKSNDGTSNLMCTSFCTVSASLRHDACAIWAHLKPVLELIRHEYACVKKIHFQSDGPTTQYRNKTNLFLFRYFCIALGLEEASWNFSEAGHGKGPADGIGGVIKKAADQAVAHGNDITNATSLITYLKTADLRVKLFEASAQDIKDVEELVPADLVPIPNTMKLHQLVWSKDEEKQLGCRELTCTSCGSDLFCRHFGIGTWDFTGDSSSNPLSENSKRHSKPTQRKPNNAKNKTVSPPLPASSIQEGQWIAVIYDDEWYPGIVEEVGEDSTLHTAFMGRSNNKFYWPEKPDNQKVPQNEILCMINVAPRPISSRFFVVESFDSIEKLKCELLQ